MGEDQTQESAPHLPDVQVIRDSQGNWRILAARPLTLDQASCFGGILRALEMLGSQNAVLDLPVVPLLDGSGQWLLSRVAAEAARRAITLKIVGAEECAGPVGEWSVVVGDPTPEAVSAALMPPYGGFMDSGLAEGGRCRAACRDGGLAVTLTTASAWALDLSVLLAKALRFRWPELGEKKLELAELCLAESICNAIIHGNLGVESGMRSSMDGLRLFREQVAERLQDSARAQRRIDVAVVPQPQGSHLEITVSDQGGGFDINRHLSARIDGTGKSGRGIPLIRQMSKLVTGCDGGRTLVIII